MANLEDMNGKKDSKAQVCPVCHGRGFVHWGFYVGQTDQYATNDTGTVPCKACLGKGVVWGPT